MPPIPQNGGGQTVFTWPGLQGGAVLQPVAGYNGEGQGELTIASWNCCPAGAVTHGPFVQMNAGSMIQGTIQRSGDTKVFEIVSQSNEGTSSLRADMTNVQGWTGDWAMFMVETYSVTQCDMLNKQATFSNIKLTLEGGQAYDGCSAPWKEGYSHIGGGSSPKCDADAQCNGDTIDISFNTGN